MKHLTLFALMLALLACSPSEPKATPTIVNVPPGVVSNLPGKPDNTPILLIKPSPTPSPTEKKK